jgi:hypothetical protein
MDSQLLEIIQATVEGRRSFFSQDTIRMINYRDRPAVINHYLRTETAHMDLMLRLFAQQQTNDIANSIVRLTVPSRFLEPVRVVATNEQILNSLIQRDSQDSPCAICQEPISSGGVVLRHCSHGYHQTCISSWFSTSVRCPVCRHDIRETGLVTQTSSGATGT